MPRTVVYVQGTSEVGGSDIALQRLVAALDRHRYQAVVMLPQNGPLVAKLETAGAKVVVIDMMQFRSIRSARYQLTFLLRFWPTVIRLAALIRSEHAHLVHTNSMYCLYGGWAALLAKVPHVWHVREFPNLPKTVLRAWTAIVLRLSRRVIAMTGAVARIFGRRAPEVVVIPDGIDMVEFNPTLDGSRIRKAEGIPPHAPLIGWVARLDPWKGLEVFIRTAAQLSGAHPDAHFMVCGGELPGYEDYSARMQELGASLGLGSKLHFTGWRYRLDDIPEVMAALTVMVHTAVRPEPFGLVIVEAMACAKPVIASRTGGVPEVVDDGHTGLLVTPGDVSGYALAIGRILDDSAYADDLGNAGRSRAEEYFALNHYALHVQGLYDEILGLDRGGEYVSGDAVLRMP